MKVVVYSTPNCMACRSVKRTLEKKGIEYDSISLEQHPELVEQFQELGLTTAPIVTTEGFSFSGYRPDKIKELERRVMRARNA